ncbi:hypothetical protein RA210_U140009 [Rubrivivax sp. A210]|uniref:hypothetical protein n=1 Tax=Rubrivivax sp. A210 TaxID=2772301 RepID=UPI001917AB6F|nr:hypothetical protein [Rubrivivax sp. A210]CAD5370981.1 hypothetical protein RA210_U140009 [Rubrivivax sp. A210]
MQPAVYAIPRTTTATVLEVLPAVGLAYLAGDDAHDWTLTRSAAGPGLESLAPGQRLQLTVADHRRFALVSGYSPLA